MKRTLLDMTQDILSAMSSDEVNSISDTAESLQVATIIKNCYFNLVTKLKLPEHKTLFELTASGTTTKPNLMTLPTNVSEIIWLKYNKVTDTGAPFIDYVDFLPLEEFLHRMHRLGDDPSRTDVSSYNHSINGDSLTVFYYNDSHPDYYTTFDDNTLLFDGVNLAIDATLQKDKTIVYGRYSYPFNLVDSFVPNLDENQFPLLFEEAKAQCFYDLKQTMNERAERNAKSLKVTTQNFKKDLGKEYYPNQSHTPYNYGRKH